MTRGHDMLASDIWRRPQTGTREQRSIAAMREITRLEFVRDAAVKALSSIEYWDDIPHHQMNRCEILKLEFAETDLTAARAALHNILKE